MSASYFLRFPDIWWMGGRREMLGAPSPALAQRPFGILTLQPSCGGMGVGGGGGVRGRPLDAASPQHALVPSYVLAVADRHRVQGARRDLQGRPRAL